jgi:predicted esterase
MPNLVRIELRCPGPLFRRRSLAGLLAGLGLWAGALRAEEIDHGILAPEVRCLGASDQSYAIYLPPGYNPGRKWPMLYCFDPMARGRVPVERFQAAAERLGYIVVGSNNSRNGDMAASLRAAREMVRDTGRRLAIDENRRYAAGFSGGARVACAVAREFRLAGVVASGAGFPEGHTPAEVPFAFFGAVGREDMNYSEMHEVQNDLQGRAQPHRLAVFEGAHEWLPATVADRALEWLEVQARRQAPGSRQPDIWMGETFRKRFQEAQAQTEPGAAYEEGLELLADFKTLADTTGLEAWLAAQRETRAVRRYLAAEKQSLEEEAQWRERLGAAISEAMQGGPATTGENAAAADFLDRRPLRQKPWEEAEGAQFGNAAFLHDKIPGLERREFDRFARLQREASDATAQWDRHIAVRRVIRSFGASLREQATEKILAKDYDEAAALLNLAIVLQPGESGAYFRLAWVRALQGHKDEARRQKDKAVSHGFNDPTQLRELSRALSAGGDRTLTVLEPMFITARREVATSYGLGLTIYANPETRELVKILVTAVTPDSEAAAWGLGQGEEILRVDGRSIHSFAADFSPEGEFSRLFCQRRTGETINLEILDLPEGKPRTISLTQGHTAKQVLYPWLTPD